MKVPAALGPLVPLAVAGAVAYFALRTFRGARFQEFVARAETEPGATGVVGRAAGLVGLGPSATPSATIGDLERPVIAGPLLGKPRNTLLVAGAFRDPLEGATVRPLLLARTYPVNVVLENQSAVPRQGVAQVQLVGGLVSTREETLPRQALTLAPGELREVRFTAPQPTPGSSWTARLYWSGYLLERISFRVGLDRI